MTGDWNARSWHRFIYICGKAATFIPHSSFKRGVQPESKDAPSQEQTLIFFFHFCYNKTILRTFTPMRFSGDTPGMMVLGKQ